MHFQERKEGVNYAVTLRPSRSNRELLREVEIDIFRKSPSLRGYLWKIKFDDKAKNKITLEFWKYTEDSTWKMYTTTVTAEELEPWQVKEIADMAREYGPKQTIEHLFRYLEVYVFNFPLRKIFLRAGE